MWVPTTVSCGNNVVNTSVHTTIHLYYYDNTVKLVPYYRKQEQAAGIVTLLQ